LERNDKVLTGEHELAASRFVAPTEDRDETIKAKENYNNTARRGSDTLHEAMITETTASHSPENNFKSKRVFIPTGALAKWLLVRKALYIDESVNYTDSKLNG
jgi:hypothetical protein